MSEVLTLKPGETSPCALQGEIADCYLAFATHVIIARALPDGRDGLKPVHRRILYGMRESGFTADRPYRKSARAVGDVMGKYHPHGDSSIYDALVRMAQDWSLSEPLIDGQGNFGSIDGDAPAAMRYTEARLSRMAHELTDDLMDLDPKRPEMVLNYDESERLPSVLPVRVPNLLINGASGIAVGLATEIPTHNLGEVIDATIALMSDPGMSLDELMTYLPGPDFPTGGVVYDRRAIYNAYNTGRGAIPLSGKMEVVTEGSHERIVVSEIPYNMNKASLVVAINNAAKAGSITGISEVRDESSNAGLSVVIDIKRDADGRLVLNTLRKITGLDCNFSMNANCVDEHARPRSVGVIAMLQMFIDFRRKTVFERTEYQLGKERDRMHLSIGYYVARSAIEDVIRTIRASHDSAAAKVALAQIDFVVTPRLRELLLMAEPDEAVGETMRLDGVQVGSIVQMRLAALTAMELESIDENIRSTSLTISEYERILNEPAYLDEKITSEMLRIKDRFGRPRRTRLVAEPRSSVGTLDLIEEKTVLLTITSTGWVKTTPTDSYRTQTRGGKGKTGMATKEDDYVIQSMVCSNHDTLIVFTSRGVAHTLGAHEILETEPNARGKPIQNYIDIRTSEGETITNIVVQPREDEGKSLVFVTDRGDVRRNLASDFGNVNRAGKIAMKLEDDEGREIARLVSVIACADDEDIVLYTDNYKAIRFQVSSLRVFKDRKSTGVTGIRMPDDVRVVGAIRLAHNELEPIERRAWADDAYQAHTDDEQLYKMPPARIDELLACEQMVMTVTATGFGKRFSGHAIRNTARGGGGIEVGRATSGTGALVRMAIVNDTDNVTIMTSANQVIRFKASEIRVTKARQARGVKLVDLDKNVQVVDVSIVPDNGEQDVVSE